MKPLSLKTKYICGICGLILSVTLALLVYIRMEFKKNLEAELAKRGISVARNLAAASITPIITENYVTLQLLVNDLKKFEDGVHYVYIITAQGEIAAHSFRTAFPRDLLKLDRPDMNSNTPLIQPLQIEQELLEDISVAIDHGNFGRVHIGISKELIEGVQRKVVLESTPFIAAILLLGSAGAWWFAGRITRPVAELVSGVRSVGEGTLGAVIISRSNDEIGELARAFNRMVVDLQTRRAARMQEEIELNLQARMMEIEVAEHQKAREELAFKQQQLEELNNSLENRVNSALDELRLKDRIMLAQGRQAAMGEMINNIAHQWRQPLNNLGLIVQSIKADYDYNSLTAEKMTEDVEKIMNTIMFMSQTINDFSSFFSDDKVKTTFHVSQALTKVIAMIEASISKQGVHIVVEERNSPVAINGYYNEYKQVLLNLLNNARQALLDSKADRPAITVSIFRENDQAVIQVRDNAGGIPETIIGQVFDPYFTTKEHGKGTGIGLYMSKTIIEEHFCGVITVSNSADGAEFTVSIPCAKDGV